ncbi:hypothetical protein E5676_scaffold862G00430 [Cucumis melo var. makuwa]|uniref:Uncharacterized protein n=1 Tax=Cucumis melo var. makuwa TaxID=1194695 RepID=A0A5D3DQ10_CUCMM|nr:hypothetical protein E5676_scaffold862G00430 [Cucumis melo var. makuwa]
MSVLTTHATDFAVFSARSSTHDSEKNNRKPISIWCSYMGESAGNSQPFDPTVNQTGPSPPSTLGAITQSELELEEDDWHCSR